MTRRGATINDQLRTIAAERNSYRRSRELDRLALQLIRNAAHRKKKSSMVRLLSTPKAWGWHSLQELPRLLKKRGL